MIAYWERDKEWMGDGLVGAWCPSKTGSTGLTLPDLSGFGNVGILTNMDRIDSWETNENANAIVSDGIDDYTIMRLRQSYELSTQPISFSWWALANINGSCMAALSSQTSISSWLQLGQSGSAFNLFNRSDAGGDASQTGGTYVSANWRQFVVVRDATRYMSMFVDGTRVINLVGVGGGTTTINAFTLAGFFRGAFGASNYSAMRWDDARIYLKALTPVDINEFRNSKRGGGILIEPPRRRSFQGVTVSPNRNRSSRYLCFPG